MSIGPLESKENIKRLKTGDVAVFESFYREYYRYLKVIAVRYINDDSQAEDIVQDSFMELWRRKDSIEFQLSVKAYLSRSVVNKALNWIRIRGRWTSDEDGTDENLSPAIAFVDQEIEADDLGTYLKQVIDQLPEKRRIIFTMSRFEDMSHKEIAEKLDISVKTVENQMTKALKVMRLAVQAFNGPVN